MPDDPTTPPGAAPDPIDPVPTAATPVPPVTPQSANPANPADPVAPGGTVSASGLTPNIAAALSVLGTIVTGIVFLLIEKRDKFVRFWAMQAILFGVAWILLLILLAAVGFVLWHIPVIGDLWGLAYRLVHLGVVVVWIIMMYQAFSGKEWELPVLGKLAREQLARMPVA